MNTSNNCYLQLTTTGGTFYIELDGDIPISVNKTVFDVRNISAKKTGNSKNIAIPGTKNNNIVLGQLWDINASTINFSLNVKNSCFLFADDQIVMRGYLQIIGVKKMSKSDSQGNQEAYYQAVLFDDANGFIDTLGDSYLTDMDISRYNHILTGLTVFGSSANTYSDGYYYFHPYKFFDTQDQNSYPYLLGDFKPAVFAKTYIDQMFYEGGYTYSSATFNSAQYESLIIPFNGQSVSGDNTQYLYNVGFNNLPTSYSYYRAGVANEGAVTLHPVMFDKVSSAPFTNPFTTYSTTTGLSTPQYLGNESVDASFAVQLAVECAQNSYLFGEDYNGISVASETSDSYVTYYINVYLGPTQNSGGGDININQLILAQTITYNAYNAQKLYRARATGTAMGYAAGTTSIATVNIGNLTHSWAQDPTYLYGVWVEAWMIAGNGKNNTTWWTATSGGNITNDVPILKMRIGKHATINSYKNLSTTDFLPNSTVDLNQFRARNIKKKDFFSSISQMLNLIIETDPLNDKNLYIESRDVYYANGSVLDWSNKLDIMSDVEIKFLSELQNTNKFNFNWEDDQQNDELLKLYFLNTNKVYGEYVVNIENQFLNVQTRDIKPIFSMTPTALNGYNQPVPYILNEFPKNNIRVLSKGAQPIALPWVYKRFQSGVVSNVDMSYYNWAGEYDHPITPTWSLNWGVNEEIFYDTLSYLPNNTLYNNFYQAYVNQILNGRVIIAKFFLTNSDVANLRMNSRIWLDQTKCYFVINQIKDFNPVEPGLTTVELLRYDY